MPLWHGEAPDWAKEAWQDQQVFLRGDDENWQFWLDFYEGILRGDQYSPAQLDLMDEIAQMPKEDWDKPTEQVNAIVAEKYATFIRNAFKRPETIVFDKENVQFSVQDDVQIDPDFLKRCVTMIRNLETERFRRSNSVTLSDELVAIIERLERTVANDTVSPLDMYDESKQFLNDAAEYIQQHPENDNDLLARYMADATKVSELIYNSDEKVRDMAARMSPKQVALPDENSPEAKAIIGAIEVAAELSVGPLKLSLKGDLVQLLAALGRRLPLHHIRVWQYRLASRLLEIRSMAMEARELVLSKLTAENLWQATETFSSMQSIAEPWLFGAGLAFVIYNFFNSKGTKDK